MTNNVTNNLNGSIQKPSQERSYSSKKNIYCALKASSVALICIGVVGSVGGAAWAWPQVANGISQGLKGLSPATGLKIAEVIGIFVKNYFEIIAACLQMRGDIGGWCALFVTVIGGAILVGPIVIAFGAPIIPGICLAAGGTSLWEYADRYKEDF